MTKLLLRQHMLPLMWTSANYRYVHAATGTQQIFPLDHICSRWTGPFIHCILQGMGFSKSKAKEALQENNHDLEAAIEWLVANCI